MNPPTVYPEPAPPVVSVVIPSYRRREGVLALLADLRRQRGVAFEIIVVDDASGDGSAEAIATRYPAVTLLRNARNGGPCVTRNRGVRAARGEFIVGFDSDVSLPDPDLLRKVADGFARDPATTGFAFRLLRPDGQGDDHGRWWHPVPIAAFADRPFETSYFSGTAYAFRRREVLAAGLFPEWLYMHFEEVVLAYRLLDQGGKLRYEPGFTAVHHAAPVARRGEIERYYKPRNQVLFAGACLPPWPALAYAVPRAAFQLGKALLHGSLGSCCRALRDGLRTVCAPDFPRSPVQAETLRRIRTLSDQSFGGSAELLPS